MSQTIEAAAALHREGRLEEAAAAYGAILQQGGDSFDAAHLLGVVRLQQGRAEEAALAIGRALRSDPDVAEAHYHLALAQRSLGRHGDAVESYHHALALRPDYAEAQLNLANALRDLRQLVPAVESYRRFIELRPEVADAHYHLANALHTLGQGEAALASYHRCLELRPKSAEAHYNMGITLRDLGRREDAMESYRRALVLHPDMAEAHNNLGVALRELRRSEEALACFGRAIELQPDDAAAQCNQGAVLRDLNRAEEALACYRRALRIAPNMAAAHHDLAGALVALDRHEEAVVSYRRAVELDPGHADAFYGLGNALRELEQPEAAIAAFERALEACPDHRHAFGALAIARRRICDWSTAEDDARALTEHVRTARSIVRPFAFLAFSDDPADQLRCASTYLDDRLGNLPPPVRRTPTAGEGTLAAPAEVRRRRRRRLGYLSADLREHAVARLVVELLELHDRERFEVLAFSIGPDDGSAMRGRLESAFDRFHDLRGASDRQVAELMAREEVDIAIDLNGHTRLGRPEILAHRPAPVQVAYLGYPGTMGADFVDYALVDSFTAPDDAEAHFAECLVRLPDCYQANDRRREIAEAAPTRAASGLPEQGFVFCSFNQNFKITPEVFSVWMCLLDAVPDSVLWLLRSHALVEANLRREAVARAIDPERLIFAPYLAQAEHLARHRLAGLFLDTLPYGAHTTASDSLWAGLPVLTCAGRSFPSRVAGSLLQAIGLPELITTSLADYEALALTLARDPTRLTALRTKLAQNRATTPLFDTDRHRRSIEAAYTEMWRRFTTGQPPAPIAIAREDRSD